MSGPNESSFPILCRWPVMNIATTRGFLGVRERLILEHIHTGRLPAWDIGIVSDRPHRREIRILAQSVAELANGQPAQRLSLNQIIVLLFGPAEHAFIPASTLAQIFVCDNSHVVNLIKTGSLDVIKMRGKPAWRRGHGGTARIPFASVIEFVRKRRITPKPRNAPGCTRMHQEKPGSLRGTGSPTAKQSAYVSACRLYVSASRARPPKNSRSAPGRSQNHG